ncbi:DNA methyltransferase [Cuniculiplasma sp. SKW3]|uniref:DNA methyltransferase n=1 Tax=Cuniculiplasma sp. SKW3 TaxID=3400170 RepID=UPI003FCFD695
MNSKVLIERSGEGRITISTPYDPELISKFKEIKGHKWNPEIKKWSFPLNFETLKDILKIFGNDEVEIKDINNNEDTENENQIELLTVKEASKWASEYTGRNITPSNISYLVQYGRVRKISLNRLILIDKRELMDYYNSNFGKRELLWKEKLGEDLNWNLSFDYLKESDTTKHVHRLHPYKGKFIPQLVRYFLDEHTDEFKRDIYFHPGDIVLDPFCGSGTTLVEANELGINAVGIDISQFNSLIANVKVGKYDLQNLKSTLSDITEQLRKFVYNSQSYNFEKELSEKLNLFNNRYFPSPEFKYKIRKEEIDEKLYASEKEEEFSKTFTELLDKYKIELTNQRQDNFLDVWYLKPVRDEIDFVYSLVKKIDDETTRNAVMIVLSRTIRSCRATTHSDLATLIEPVKSTYYCTKHRKICKPIFSILGWWERYSQDTINRLKEFNDIRTETKQLCITGDSMSIDIIKNVKSQNYEFGKLIEERKIDGIFTSPPYVGMIDYHEQHSYAYDLFGFKKNSDLEIGRMSLGQGKEARNRYIYNISHVLVNCKKYLKEDYDVFLVANDRFNIYPRIAEKSHMKIVEQFRRPVLNRTEKDKSAYSETIFHLKESD